MASQCQGETTAGERGLFDVAGGRHASRTISSAGTVGRVHHVRLHESGLLISAHRAGVRRIGIGDHARRAGSQPRVDEGADQRRTVALFDHAGLTNEEINATRALRLGSET